MTLSYHHLLWNIWDAFYCKVFSDQFTWQFLYLIIDGMLFFILKSVVVQSGDAKLADHTSYIKDVAVTEPPEHLQHLLRVLQVRGNTLSKLQVCTFCVVCQILLIYLDVIYRTNEFHHCICILYLSLEFSSSCNKHFHLLLVRRCKPAQ